MDSSVQEEKQEKQKPLAIPQRRKRKAATQLQSGSQGKKPAEFVVPDASQMLFAQGPGMFSTLPALLPLETVAMLGPAFARAYLTHLATAHSTFSTCPSTFSSTTSAASSSQSAASISSTSSVSSSVSSASSTSSSSTSLTSPGLSISITAKPLGPIQAPIQATQASTSGSGSSSWPLAPLPEISTLPSFAVAEGIFYRWEYEMEDNLWGRFDVRFNLQAEDQLAYGSPSCNLFLVLKCDKTSKIHSMRYILDTRKMEQTNFMTQNVRKVRRLKITSPLLSLASSAFTPSEGYTLQTLPLSPDAEWVAKHFYKSCYSVSCRIVGLYKVGAEALSLSYNGLREGFAKRLAKENKQMTETPLWHGAALETLHKIRCGGFNRDYCVHGKFGKGNYFARHAAYSVNSRFSKRDPETGLQYMFLCSVLVGEIGVGTASMSSPPDGVDTLVDSIEKPTIYCAYQDCQALPLYLVEFVSIF